MLIEVRKTYITLYLDLLLHVKLANASQVIKSISKLFGNQCKL